MMMDSHRKTKVGELRRRHQNLRLILIARLDRFKLQIDFNPDQHLPLERPSSSLLTGHWFNFSKRSLNWRVKFEEDAAIFYKDYKQILFEHHNRPLLLISPIHDVDLRRGVVDFGSSLNIMPFSTIEAVGISRDHVVELSFEVSGFGGNASFTLG